MVNWAAGLLALIILVTRVLAQGLLRLRVPMNAADRGISDMLLWTYIIYMAAHIGLGTQRVMYLYHYFIPLMLTFLMVPIAWRLIWMSRQGSRTMQITLPLLLLAGAISMSHFLWPISRQEPLTHEACEMRNALVVLIECR